ncbi:Uncharacterised protein [Yersinia intermedia]|uniref:hypothetical protein n=1 Tax=Yersinia intermedia TaxID=631 RepID=UPI0005E03905|nr:hypothetical protein [Yersinia intermedia]CNJ80686.1 Uncharacterised protein [Yersinia intermedia]
MRLDNLRKEKKVTTLAKELIILLFPKIKEFNFKLNKVWLWESGEDYWFTASERPDAMLLLRHLLIEGSTEWDGYLDNSVKSPLREYSDINLIRYCRKKVKAKRKQLNIHFQRL